MPALLSVLGLIAAAALATVMDAFPQGGAPVCGYADTTSAQMTNNHGAGQNPTATMKVTQMGAAYQVAITGIASYNGLIIWVRPADQTQHVGQFDMANLANVGLKGKDCTAMSGASSGANSTLGHFQANAKTMLAFTWTPDAAVQPGMAMVAEAVIVGANKRQWQNANPGMFIAGTAPAAAAPVAAAVAAPTSAPAAVAVTTTANVVDNVNPATATTAPQAAPAQVMMTLPNGSVCVIQSAVTPIAGANVVAPSAAMTTQAAAAAMAATTAKMKATKVTKTKKAKATKAARVRLGFTTAGQKCRRQLRRGPNSGYCKYHVHQGITYDSRGGTTGGTLNASETRKAAASSIGRGTTVSNTFGSDSTDDSDSPTRIRQWRISHQETLTAEKENQVPALKRKDDIDDGMDELAAHLNGLSVKDRLPRENEKTLLGPPLRRPKASSHRAEMDDEVLNACELDVDTAATRVTTKDDTDVDGG
ncbi:hypothetical protein HDU93_009014 [Gonapodya sp. JEL0774]|nr:hypothetical protein HDU93_009014 [Gonapodya sp. JEL0774]